MTSPAERPTTTGFTLLEVLIVIAILGLALGLFASRGADRNKALTLKGSGDALAEDLRITRTEAIVTGREASLMIIPTPPGWKRSHAPLVVLPSDLMITVASARAFGAGASDSAVRFEPDGSSTGAVISLAQGTHRLEIDVDWLTGRVSIAALP